MTPEQTAAAAAPDPLRPYSEMVRAYGAALLRRKPEAGVRGLDIMMALAERAAEIERLRAERDQTVADALPALSAEIKQLRAELDEARTRLANAVWVTPQRLSGTPCIGGTRISVDNITGYAWHDGIDGAQVAYPDLTRAQILIACWYAAGHSEGLGRVWGAWAREHHTAMWAGDWDRVPDPPRRPAASDGWATT